MTLYIIRKFFPALDPKIDKIIVMQDPSRFIQQNLKKSCIDQVCRSKGDKPIKPETLI